MNDELQRSRRVLEDKHFENSRANEESAKKSDSNSEMRLRLSDLEKEFDVLKLQR
jgi:hypothetical protein